MEPAALALVFVSLATTYGIGYWQGRVHKRPRTSLDPSRGPRSQIVAQAREAFIVCSPDGDLFYEGVSGGDARRTIEALRRAGTVWQAYRDGITWDWGPR